jgi:Zn-dependent protease with chaperone function
MTGPVAATYFDGRTSAALAVAIQIENQRVRVSGAATRDEPIEAVVISERLGLAPRQLKFSDGAFCEVRDIDALSELLAAAGRPERAIERAERTRWIVLAALAATVFGGFAVYRWGLPAAAAVTARRAPQSVLDQLSAQVLGVFDGGLFEPTRLPAGQRGQLEARFEGLRLGAARNIQARLIFRRSPSIGPNALSLPSGQVVVTDELVEALSTEQVLAVLAHELGHIEGRHGLRNLIQSSILGILVTWYVGDVSTLVTAAPTIFLQLKYSRDFEREADDFAAMTLENSGLRRELFAGALQAIEAAQRKDADGTGIPAYLSTHPSTAERIDRIKARR